MKEDRFLMDVMPRLKSLMARIDLPASFDESVMVWCMMQRIILEVDARLTWLLVGKSAYHDPTMKRRPVMNNIVGAITDQMETAESLYRVRMTFAFFCSILKCFGRRAFLVG